MFDILLIKLLKNNKKTLLLNYYALITMPLVPSFVT